MSQSDPMRFGRDLKVDSNIMEKARSQTDKGPMRFGRDLKVDPNIMEEARSQSDPLRLSRELKDDSNTLEEARSQTDKRPMRFGRDLKVDSNIVEEVRAQQSWGEKHLMRSGRDLDAGAEISLNDLEERDNMGSGCKTSARCSSSRDCRGHGRYSRCHNGRFCCTDD